MVSETLYTCAVLRIAWEEYCQMVTCRAEGPFGLAQGGLCSTQQRCESDTLQKRVFQMLSQSRGIQVAYGLFR